MITIYRKESVVCVAIDARYPLTGTTFEFTWGAGSAWAAALLVDALRGVMNDRIAEIRRKAYEDGWRDAKAKCAKETWFSTSWETE